MLNNACGSALILTNWEPSPAAVTLFPGEVFHLLSTLSGERTCRFSTKGTVWNADGPVCTFRWTEGQGDRRQTSTCLGLSGYPLHPRAASSSATEVGRDGVGRSVCYVWQGGCARLAEEWERLIRKSEPQVACHGKEQASEWYWDGI